MTRPKCKKKLNRSLFKQHLNQKPIFAWFLNKNEPVRARFIQICDLLHCHNTIIIGFKANHFARNQFTRQDLLRQWVFDLLLNSTF